MEETPEEENNGYVVFKLNILGSAGNKGGGEGGGAGALLRLLQPSAESKT